MKPLKQKQTLEPLRTPGLVSNNKSLTKNHQRQRKVLNIAFFVPKIHQACNLLKGYTLDLCIKNEVHILRYGRVKEQNTIPFYGNMFSRLVTISNTRPPVSKTGGLTKLKSPGGQPMPLNTSKRAIIRTIQTVKTQNGIIATIHTRYNQKAVIGRVFSSVKHLQSFIQSQGLSPELLGGRI